VVLISFREWLHSYTINPAVIQVNNDLCSHLFQRVASFLLDVLTMVPSVILGEFSSLSESGFIPTKTGIC